VRVQEINRGSRVNPWEQIAADLRAEIASGRYSDDAPLPSLTVLEQRYGVNRKTARKAYLRLKAEGLVEVVAGRGYFVAAGHT
jgi:GntR family transcriptional regulator